MFERTVLAAQSSPACTALIARTASEGEAEAAITPAHPIRIRRSTRPGSGSFASTRTRTEQPKFTFSANCSGFTLSSDSSQTTRIQGDRRLARLRASLTSELQNTTAAENLSDSTWSRRPHFALRPVERTIRTDSTGSSEYYLAVHSGAKLHRTFKTEPRCTESW